MSNISARMGRLFNKSGNCFDVAIDHGMFDERSFLPGIENMSDAIATIIKADPDAIQLSPGTAPILQNSPGRDKPALVLRTDIANCYGKVIPQVVWSEVIDAPVEQAMVLDAACVVVNLLQLPDQPELHRQCVQNINGLKRECEIYGMPLMVEPLVMQGNEISGGYMVDGDIDKILPLVRQAVELGADIIKADPCEQVEEYHQVIEIAQKLPVLVRGGGKAGEEEIFARTIELMKQGARGIVYGRNVIQHENPRAMTQALMAVVHNDADINQAMNILKAK